VECIARRRKHSGRAPSFDGITARLEFSADALFDTVFDTVFDPVFDTVFDAH